LSTKRNFAAITSRRFRQQQKNSGKIRIKPKCRGDILADKQMLEKFVKGQIDFWTEHNPFEDFEAPYFPKSVCEAKISTKKSLGNKNNNTRDQSHLAVKNTSWPQTCHPGESNTRPVYVMLGILDNLTSWIERKKQSRIWTF